MSRTSRTTSDILVPEETAPTPKLRSPSGRTTRASRTTSTGTSRSGSRSPSRSPSRSSPQSRSRSRVSAEPNVTVINPDEINPARLDPRDDQMVDTLRKLNYTPLVLIRARANHYIKAVNPRGHIVYVKMDMQGTIHGLDRIELESDRLIGQNLFANMQHDGMIECNGDFCSVEQDGTSTYFRNPSAKPVAYQVDDLDHNQAYPVVLFSSLLNDPKHALEKSEKFRTELHHRVAKDLTGSIDHALEEGQMISHQQSNFFRSIKNSLDGVDTMKNRLAQAYVDHPHERDAIAAGIQRLSNTQGTLLTKFRDGLNHNQELHAAATTYANNVLAILDDLQGLGVHLDLPSQLTSYM